MVDFKKAFYFLSIGCLLMGQKLIASDCSKALKNPLNPEWQTVAFKRHCPLAHKITTWMILREGKLGTFEDYARFIQTNPDWPWEHKLRRNAEAKMDGTESLQILNNFYKNAAPKSLPAAGFYANTLQSHGHHENAAKQVRHAWHTLEATPEEQKDFYTRFKKILRDQDHEARVVFLVKAENFKAAEKVAACMKGARRTHIERWLKIFSQKKDLPQLSASAIAHQDDWIVYQYVRHLRRQYDTRAEQILIHHPQHTKAFPELWWRERSVLSRRALENGTYDLAYKLVKNHHLNPGADFSEAEFFLGWVSLRFLNQPDRALKHFQNLYEHVKSPISLAKGAYWLGRTYEHKRHVKQANYWFQKAAQYKTTYYGQIAQRMVSRKNDGKPLSKITITDPMRQHFHKREFVQAARLFVAAGLPREALSFLHLLAKRSKNDVERFLTIQLTHTIAQEFVVDIVREITPHTETAVVEAYPKLPKKYDYQGVDPDFVHAVIRRESGFNPTLVSSKDAQGLMQVLPDTCKRLSEKYKFKYEPLRLLKDPSYNIKVGSIFLKHLLDSYKGSFVLTLAAYNAGPKPVQEWIQYFGDPRTSEVDMIDWIEKISYKETREYVQRVLESFVVYKYYRK